MLSFDPYDEASFNSYDEYEEFLEDEVCPVCDAELESGRPCEFCDYDPLTSSY